MSESAAISWLQRTGQRWKAIVFLLLIAVALGTIIALAILSKSDFAPRCELSMAEVGLVIVAMLWLILSVRCPTCGGRVALKYLRDRSVTEWLTVLWVSGRCPFCNM